MDFGGFQHYADDAPDPFDKYANFSVRCFPPARASRAPDFQALPVPPKRFEEFDTSKLTQEAHDHFFSQYIHPPERPGVKYPKSAGFEDLDPSRKRALRSVKSPRVFIRQMDLKKLEEQCPKYNYFSETSLVHGQGHGGT